MTGSIHQAVLTAKPLLKLTRFISNALLRYVQCPSSTLAHIYHYRSIVACSSAHILCKFHSNSRSVNGAQCSIPIVGLELVRQAELSRLVSSQSGFMNDVNLDYFSVWISISLHCADHRLLSVLDYKADPCDPSFSNVWLYTASEGKRGKEKRKGNEGTTRTSK